MKRALPVLGVLLGLGSCFFAAQSRQSDDPFQRYLAGTHVNQLEAATMRFAAECSVDVSAVPPRFADLPDNSWLFVKDLYKGLHGLQTDFFGTAEVWQQSNRVLVEMWEMELDVGSESRLLYCFERRSIMRVESVDWTLPLTTEHGKPNPGWGYEQRWRVGTGGKYQVTLRQFVDTREHPITEPRLGPNGQNLERSEIASGAFEMRASKGLF